MGMGGLWNGEIEEETARGKKGKGGSWTFKKKKVPATKKKNWMRERKRERSKTEKGQEKIKRAGTKYTQMGKELK